MVDGKLVDTFPVDFSVGFVAALDVAGPDVDDMLLVVKSLIFGLVAVGLDVVSSMLVAGPAEVEVPDDICLFTVVTLSWVVLGDPCVISGALLVKTVSGVLLPSVVVWTCLVVASIVLATVLCALITVVIGCGAVVGKWVLFSPLVTKIRPNTKHIEPEFIFLYKKGTTKRIINFLGISECVYFDTRIDEIIVEAYGQKSGQKFSNFTYAILYLSNFICKTHRQLLQTFNEYSKRLTEENKICPLKYAPCPTAKEKQLQFNLLKAHCKFYILAFQAFLGSFDWKPYFDITISIFYVTLT